MITKRKAINIKELNNTKNFKNEIDNMMLKMMKIRKILCLNKNYHSSILLSSSINLVSRL